jgi:methionyl aminopeptidase
VQLKTPDDLARMREAGRVVRAVLDEVVAAAIPGVSTAELDRLAEDRTRALGAAPAFKGYLGYPASICISVNEEVVHGIPSAARVLREGDVVGLDFGALLAGFHGDAAETVIVGKGSDVALRLVHATRDALAAGIAAAVAGGRVGDIGAAVQARAEAAGFSVVRQFVGHGIGRSLHEAPQVPNFGLPGSGSWLRPGLVLAIEPMLNAGGPDVRTLEDGWTAVTEDGSLSAHFEHTVAITDGGPEILTRSGN